MEPYEVKFSGEIIRVDDTHVIVGEDFFKLEDLGGARIADTTRALRNAARFAKYSAFIALGIIAVSFCFYGGYKGGSLSGIVLGLLFGIGVGGFVGFILYGLAVECGARNIEGTTRAFSLLGKNGAALLTLTEEYDSESREFDGEAREYDKSFYEELTRMKRMVAEIERRIQK